MSGADVNVKISADTSQIRQELRLLDKDLEQLGARPSNNTQTRGGSSEESSKSEPAHENTGITSKSDRLTEQSNKLNTLLLKEIILIRKALQKQTGTGGNNPPPPTNTQNNSNSNNNPPPNTPPPTNNGGNNNPKPTPQPAPGGGGNGMGQLLGGILGFHTLQQAYGFVSQTNDISLNSEKSAYNTFGSTLAYKDYYNAVKGARGVGTPLGYKSQEVLDTQKTNMSKAGFKDIESTKADTSAILSTAKLYGIDKNQLASASGKVTAMGGASLGDQKRFTNMLASSIEESKMQGRENEQLGVLEEIADTLHEQLVNVKSEQIGNVVGFQTMLAKGNENLKGQSGMNLVNKLDQGIKGKNSAWDSLLRISEGESGRYNGLSGLIQLQRDKEKGLSDPENLKRVISGWNKVNAPENQWGSDYSRVQLMEMGLSQEQIDELFKHTDEIQKGTYVYDPKKTEETADKSLQERKKNYQKSSVGKKEIYDANAQGAKEDIGNKVNSIFEIGRDMYNNLGDGGRMTVDIGIEGAKIVGMGAVAKRLFSGGGASGGASGASGGASGGSGIFNKFNLPKMPNINSGNIAKSLPKAGKALGVVGTAYTLGSGIIDYTEAKTTERKGEVVGDTLGTIGGGLAGAKAGAMIGTAIAPGIGTVIGGALGGIGGSILGGSLGGGVGKSIGGAVGGTTASEAKDQETKKADGIDKNTEAVNKNTEAVNRANGQNSNIPKPQPNEDKGNSMPNVPPGNADEPSWYKPWTWGAKSHAVGNDYVPTDNYKALLHKGEMVLTKHDADRYREGKDYSDIIKAMGNIPIVNNQKPNAIPYDSAPQVQMPNIPFMAPEPSTHSTTNSQLSPWNININLSGNISGMDSSNQKQIVDAVVAKISSSNVQDILSNGWTRVQNF